MFTRMREKTKEFQKTMTNQGIDIALLMDRDSVFYFTGVHDYLGMDFGRPTIFIVPKDGECSLITPSLERNMVREMTWVEKILPWTDGEGDEWREHIRNAIGRGNSVIGIEKNKTHAVLLGYLDDQFPNAAVRDIFNVLSRQRMVKTPQEIEIMKEAGQVAVAMCEAARNTISDGVPEYEVALAIIKGGTRKAAEFLSKDQTSSNRMFSPLVHDLQILQTGPDMHMVHRRASTKIIRSGDSVYMCFCNLVDYKGFKLGFDRQYFIGSYTDEEAKVYHQALKGQRIALEMIRAGVKASDVHKASAQYYADQGHGICYRTGRAVGYSRLEKPELRVDDDTILEEGMTFAVDGAVSLESGIAGRVGDSVVVTRDGFEYLTSMDKSLQVL